MDSPGADEGCLRLERSSRPPPLALRVAFGGSAAEGVARSAAERVARSAADFSCGHGRVARPCAGCRTWPSAAWPCAGCRAVVGCRRLVRAWPCGDGRARCGGAVGGVMRRCPPGDGCLSLERHVMLDPYMTRGTSPAGLRLGPCGGLPPCRARAWRGRRWCSSTTATAAPSPARAPSPSSTTAPGAAKAGAAAAAAACHPACSPPLQVLHGP
jgi:hypothetical protein